MENEGFEKAPVLRYKCRGLLGSSYHICNVTRLKAENPKWGRLESQNNYLQSVKVRLKNS